MAPTVDTESIRRDARSAPHAVVVGPSDWLPAMAAWIDHRQRQGYHLVFVDGRLSSDRIRSAIGEAAAKGRLRYVVLIGDADPRMATDAEIRAHSVPTFFAQAQITPRWGSEPLIATDNPYGDLDDDGIPELAVGRISVESAEQLGIVLQKVITYERLPAAGLWRRRIHFVASVGGFGPLADAVLETTARRFITDGVPAAYQASMTYANWRSPYCPDPRRFRETLLSRIRDGCLVWVYIGHGQPQRLERMQVEDTLFPVLESDDVPLLQSEHGMPIAVMLSCYTGAFDFPRDCLGELMLRLPAGPVAVVAGSRISMPYAMAVLGTEMMDEFFHKRPRTLGDVFLNAKQSLASNTPTNASGRKLLDSLASSFSPLKDDLNSERAEHQWLFNLLGDPMLQLKHPQSVPLKCRRQVESGEILRVDGVAPLAGDCLLELVCRRDRSTTPLSPRRQLDGSETALAAMTQAYQMANHHVWQSREVRVKPGQFAVNIPVPKHAHGASFVRVFIEGSTDSAMGEAPVYIQRARPPDDLVTPKPQR
jgi:hypothetical protein